MTPDKQIKVSDEVLVVGHEVCGSRIVKEVLNQTIYPGGVVLDKPVGTEADMRFGMFTHWNEDALSVVRRA